MVHVEWDRAHDEFDAIVHAESDEGVIVSRVHDIVPLRGFKWLPRNEIVSIEPLEADSTPMRLAALRGTAPASLDTGLTHLSNLLAHLKASSDLVGVFRAERGSDELLVGRIKGAEKLLVVDLVSPGGVWQDEERYELGEIISIEWQSDYLLALADLLPAREPESDVVRRPLREQSHHRS